MLGKSQNIISKDYKNFFGKLITEVALWFP